jgi:hypothetical protein
MTDDSSLFADLPTNDCVSWTRGHSGRAASL